jgi:hypothetical protein
MATARNKAAARPKAPVKTASAAKPAPAEAPPAPAKPAPAAAAAKAVTTVPVKAAKPAKPAKAPRAGKADKAEKADKPKKPKLVRDSFTIPKAEYAVLESLKERAAKNGNPAKKSELLRAGLKALAGMPDAAFLAALKDVPALKTGRPARV